MSEREGALLRECRDYLALWPKSGLIDEQEKRLVKRLDIALSTHEEAQTKAVPIPQGWQGSNPNDGAYDGQAPSQPERETSERGERDSVIEECARVAQDVWQSANALNVSKAAGDIMRAIRALKPSPPSEGMVSKERADEIMNDLGFPSIRGGDK